MSELINRQATFLAERQADTAFEEGRSEHAIATLRLAQQTFGADQEHIRSEHFFRLKEIAALLYVAYYELESDGGISKPTLKKIDDVHAHAIDAIRDDLRKFCRTDRNNRLMYTGAIAEKTIFALGARNFNARQNRFLLPASAEANTDKKRPKDFDVISIHRKIGGFYLSQLGIQVKTDEYAPHNLNSQVRGVYTVGLRQIDPQGQLYTAFVEPDRQEITGYAIQHETSLPQLLVREIDGTATNDEIARINDATRQMFMKTFSGVYEDE